MGSPTYLHTLESWVRSFSQQPSRKEGLWTCAASRPPISHELKHAEAQTITRTKGQFILPFVPMNHWETHVPIGWYMATTFSCIKNILVGGCWSGRCHCHDNTRNYNADNGPFASLRRTQACLRFPNFRVFKHGKQQNELCSPRKWFNPACAAKKELNKYCSLNPEKCFLFLFLFFNRNSITLPLLCRKLSSFPPRPDSLCSLGKKLCTSCSLGSCSALHLVVTPHARVQGAAADNGTWIADREQWEYR